MTKYSIIEMKKNNYGRILLIASVAGKEVCLSEPTTHVPLKCILLSKGNAGMCPYSMSKAAVIGLVKSVGKEYAETGITVNALAPAVVRTEMVENMNPEQVKQLTDKIPAKRQVTSI